MARRVRRVRCRIPASVGAIGVIGLALALTAWPAAAEDLTQYRGHTLGSSVEDVLRVSRAKASEVLTIHDQPNRIQRLEWRVPYSNPDAAEVDPATAITFSFIDGQLYEMRVDYDRTRTDSLTTADLVAGVSDVYGATAQTPTARRRSETTVSAASTLARWKDATALIDLVRGPYGDLQLFVQSVALETQARTAIATAVARLAADEPTRLQKARADAEATARDERARNKAAFRP